MTSQNTTIYTPSANGRTVRDIVEHSPALVDESWCRDLLRHTLDSLERQYATGAPHRPVSPDTIVMLGNNEALVLPAPEEVGPAGAPALAADLHALALVVHYAITAELPPEGPLGPRLYDNYSEQLTKGLDRCLGPNMRLRPKTVEDMRTMLGIEAASGDAAIHPSTVAPAPAEQPAPVPFVATPPAQELPPVETAPAPDFSQPVPPPAMPEVPPAPTAPIRQEAPAHEAPRLHTPSAAGVAPGSIGNAALPKAPTALEAATAARLHEEAARSRTTAAAPAPRARPGSVQRWGWIAGAAIVLLAAGSALVHFVQQDESRDVAALSLPPDERAANGLGPGETVIAPRADASEPAADADMPAGEPGAVDALSAGAMADAPAGLPPAAATVPGKPSDAVVNGTTYKLVIKPWGTVYVDGIDRGVSPPVKRLTLGKGLHTIQIVNPNFPDHVLTVDSGSQESTTIQHDFTAKAE